MASNSRSRQKRKIEPITYDELIGAAGMSGFVSFLNIPPEGNLSLDANLASDVRLSSDDTETSDASTTFGMQVAGMASDSNLSPDANLVLDQSTANEITPVAVSQASDVNLTPDDTLASEHEQVFNQVSDDRLASDDKTAPPLPDGRGAVSATGEALGARLFVRADGSPVDPKLVREYHLAQHGHTSSEHLVYMTLWRQAGGAEDTDQTQYRDVSIGLTGISRLASVSRRNLIRVLQSLVEKLAIEVIKHEVSSEQEAKTYRVWSMKALLQRRRARGFRWVYRSRNVVELVRIAGNGASGASLASGHRLATANNTSSGGSQATSAVAKLTGEPSDRVAPQLGSSLRKAPETGASTVVAVLMQTLGHADDDAAWRITTACRAKAPDATDEEIAHFVRTTAARVAKMRNVENPLGLLIVQVPRLCGPEALRHYREAEAARHRAGEAEEGRFRNEQERILADPNSSDEERQLARELLELGG